MPSMNIETLLAKLVEGNAGASDFALCSTQSNCSRAEVLNAVSCLIATRFLNQNITYEMADAAMNAVWAAMLEYTSENNLPLVEPCYTIYLAFDEGEYDHGDGADPVEKYTKPLFG